MGPNTIAESREILDAIRRIVQVLRVSSRSAERELGLSGAQLFVLHKLAEGSGQGMSVNDLAERTLTHQSSVSVVVSRLVDRGLVERGRSQADARRAELLLTKKGKSVLQRSPGATQDRIVQAIGEMNDTERKGLTVGLSGLTQRLGLEGGVPPLFFEESGSKTTTKRRRKS